MWCIIFPTQRAQMLSVTLLPGVLLVVHTILSLTDTYIIRNEIQQFEVKVSTAYFTWLHQVGEVGYNQFHPIS